MSSFANYFVPLAQDERTPIAQEPVKNGLRNRRSIARVVRRRAIERQRIEDAQVEQHESLTRNSLANGFSTSFKTSLAKDLAKIDLLDTRKTSEKQGKKL
jgi:hypothetical protein